MRLPGRFPRWSGACTLSRSDLPGARFVPVAAFVVAATLLPVATAAQAQTIPKLPDNPLRGRLLFESRRCNHCHGLAGVEAGTGPGLGEGRFGGSFLDLGAAMWNHVPGMSVRFEGSDLTWPHLSEDEVLELAAFLYVIEYLGRPGDAAAGRQLFDSRGCSTCHAVAGVGGRTGPDLARLKRFASPLMVAQAIWNHGPQMLDSIRARNAAPPVFREGDLADLSAFVRQSANATVQERVLIAPGNANDGKRIFSAKGCATCHPVQGRGGQGGPDLAGSDLHRSADGIAGIMWNHALRMRESMRQKGVDWPQLTPEEFANLVAYLYFLPFVDVAGDPRRGAEVFAGRSCADCHVATGGRSHPGPDLAQSQAMRSPAALVAAMWNHAPVMKEAIVSEGRPWPELTGRELRDLLAYLSGLAPAP